MEGKKAIDKQFEDAGHKGAKWMREKKTESLPDQEKTHHQHFCFPPIYKMTSLQSNQQKNLQNLPQPHQTKVRYLNYSLVIQLFVIR